MDNNMIEDLIIEKERTALDQWAEGNMLGYIQSFANDVTYFDDIGASQRMDGLDVVTQYATTLQGQIPKHRYELVNPKVQVVGDVAILTLRYHPFSLEGNPLTPWKATSIYNRTNGEWKVIHQHWSMIKENNSN